jgi:hypothetical protein
MMERGVQSQGVLECRIDEQLRFGSILVAYKKCACIMKPRCSRYATHNILSLTMAIAIRNTVQKYVRRLLFSFLSNLQTYNKVLKRAFIKVIIFFRLYH